MNKLVFVAIALFGFSASGVNASVVTYPNPANWNSNVSGITTIDFNGHNSIQYVGSSVTDSGVTLSGTNAALFYQGNNSYAGSQWLGKKWFSYEGGQNSTYYMNFNSSISALSFDFADYYNSNMTLNLFLSNGDSLTAVQGGPNAMGNVSFTSDTLFNQVTLVASNTQGPYFGIDNLAFGTSNASQVPEPATLALAALGLAGIGFSRKKKST